MTTDDRQEEKASEAVSPQPAGPLSVASKPTAPVVRRWWHRWIRTPSELRAMGVVGINMRNARFLLPNNPRKLYDLVDNKLRTKQLAVEKEMAVPETYGVISSPRDAAMIHRLLGNRDSFVIKPARGSGGKGVLVIVAREGDWFIKPSGSRLSLDEIRHHCSNILAGLFSLGGKRDVGLIEYRVHPARVLTEISFQGAPDIRVVMLHGYPVMAMLRAATRESDGRANLHQGAIGIGIDLATGRTIRAVHHGHPIERHPDLKVPVVGVQLPHWDAILDIAVTCHEMTGLGYLGVDVMIDEEKGPLMIEVNARPGLAIQLANGVGLLRRLEPALNRHVSHPHDSREQKIDFSRRTFAAS
ncbi:alpha-L-glutamate ligase-like protein [Luteolibacter flavescens]|uniref:Alpha-L-glutamate ligase-like protein n=1 Tax=Luteolibacter flavescens TaxID=1859460 RepID=A0ABT3FI29_9BACT|nr:alpha-L-glutamate ligase-like protein [Luteolibacter flavescens]MCW1883175.1 alpha-L-glutamate ligase-like protein [Luteolibacter flavescens]